MTRVNHDLESLLAAIKQHGSVAKAAIALGISKEAISKRFRKLPDEHPLKVEYQILCGKQGRPRKYPDTPDGTRERVKKAASAFRRRRQTGRVEP